VNPALAPFERLLVQARKFTRRRLVGWATALPFVAACRSKKEPPEPSAARTVLDGGAPPPKGRVLGAREWKTIEAMAARILPSDDGPGAREAGVIAFIDRQLAEPPLSTLAPMFIDLAKSIERLAHELHRRSYADLAPVEQDAMIEKLSRAELSLSLPQAQLYEVLHTLTLEGFLSDPIHGGNAEQVGWKYIAFPEPTLRERGGAHRHHPLPVVR
jgi:hypothetical protein